MESQLQQLKREVSVLVENLPESVTSRFDPHNLTHPSLQTAKTIGSFLAAVRPSDFDKLPLREKVTKEGVEDWDVFEMQLESLQKDEEMKGNYVRTESESVVRCNHCQKLLKSEVFSRHVSVCHPHEMSSTLANEALNQQLLETNAQNERRSRKRQRPTDIELETANHVTKRARIEESRKETRENFSFPPDASVDYIVTLLLDELSQGKRVKNISNVLKVLQSHKPVPLVRNDDPSLHSHIKKNFYRDLFEKAGIDANKRNHQKAVATIQTYRRPPNPSHPNPVECPPEEAFATYLAQIHQLEISLQRGSAQANAGSYQRPMVPGVQVAGAQGAPNVQAVPQNPPGAVPSTPNIPTQIASNTILNMPGRDRMRGARGIPGAPGVGIPINIGTTGMVGMVGHPMVNQNPNQPQIPVTGSQNMVNPNQPQRYLTRSVSSGTKSRDSPGQFYGTNPENVNHIQYQENNHFQMPMHVYNNQPTHMLAPPNNMG